MIPDELLDQLSAGSDSQAALSKDGLISELFRAQHANLGALIKANPAQLDRATTMLHRARAVRVAGFRASYAVAFALLPLPILSPLVHLDRRK